ncbi:hypothetical protein CDL15_Pgr011245 [Punica granatum]|nr:hypothetical protein CDL15_Pgr011245 [Punica granatum]
MLLLVLSVFSFLLLNPAEAHVGRPALHGMANLQITAACRKTSYPDLCATTLGANMDATVGVKDSTAIFKTALKAAVAEANAAISKTERLIVAVDNPMDLDCLTSCKKYYNEAIARIQEAMTDNNYNSVMSTLSSAISQISTCGDDFEPRVNKMAKINQRARGVIDNALALAGFARW